MLIADQQKGLGRMSTCPTSAAVDPVYQRGNVPREQHQSQPQEPDPSGGEGESHSLSRAVAICQLGARSDT